MYGLALPFLFEASAKLVGVNSNIAWYTRTYINMTVNIWADFLLTFMQCGDLKPKQNYEQYSMLMQKVKYLEYVAYMTLKKLLSLACSYERIIIHALCGCAAKALVGKVYL